ncbi:MAG TPA: anti-sigma factor [Solirubrobacteraceae bacterium]|nr:anti-sigma factor [Solirubrobacteraceae bacterium]
MSWEQEMDGHGSDLPNCGGDAAAYAMGALEPAEAEAFRRHLESCAVCAEELASFETVVAALPMSVPQYAPPKGLRRRVMREISSERGFARPSASPRGWVARRAVAAISAAALLALAVLGGAQLGGSSAPGPTRVFAASVGDAMVRVSREQAELIVKHLPQPGAGRIYEVWLKHGGQPPQPTRALFDVDTAGSADVVVPGSLHGASKLLVTAEPVGGTLVPTTRPVIVASLS